MQKKITLMTMFLVSIIAFLVVIEHKACATANPENKEQASHTSNLFNEEKNKFEQSAKEQVAELDRKINQLKLKIDAAGSRLAAETEQEIKQLTLKRSLVSHKMKKLKAAGKRRWDEVKQQVNTAIEDLKEAYEKAHAKIASD